jgi:hypothetical protein
MIVHETIHFRVDRHDAVDGCLGRGGADGDLQRFQGQGAVFGSGLVEELPNRSARPHKQVGVVRGRRPDVGRL